MTDPASVPASNIVADTARPRLRLSGIRKRYGQTEALRGLTLSINPSEVLGLAGPNGAGKSTLVRILSAEEPSDSGEIAWEGTSQGAGSVKPAAPRVAVVHQEPRLFPNLSVIQNLQVGREGRSLSAPSPSRREHELLAELEIGQLARRPLGDCSLVVFQLVAIARALLLEAELFLFDEPNSALTTAESAHLFEHMARLKESGRMVVLVSHRLDELAAHSDRVAIITEGRCRRVLSGAEHTEGRIAEELVIEEAAEAARLPDRRVDRRPGRMGSENLRISEWSHGRGSFRDVELTVRSGEILALLGVEGSGARELLASLARLEPATGKLRVRSARGQRAPGAKPGVGFLGADRRRSLFQNLSVGENMVARLGRPDIASPFGWLKRRAIAEHVSQQMQTFHVRARSASQPLPSLSGGNQQKVAIAATMASRPDVICLEEPTRGVDIGSKAEIYALLRRFVDQGGAVIAYCTEVPEAFELADRIAVMDSGRVARVLDVRDFDGVAALARTLAT